MFIPAYGSVAGPEYCPPDSAFDINLQDCLFTDRRGNLFTDGSFCGLEGCYTAENESLDIGLSPFQLWYPPRDECVIPGREDTYFDKQSGMNCLPGDEACLEGMSIN